MMKKLVLTGAAGRLGSYLRETPVQMCQELVSTDIVDDYRHALWKARANCQADVAV